MERLFAMSERVFANNLNVILIQIDEAHSTEWPVAIEQNIGQETPEPHKCFEDRLKRANEFVTKYNPPFNVIVDGFSNDFAEKFRAWPDKYHCVDSSLKVFAKSEYHLEGDSEAKIIVDCTVLLEQLINKSI
jgi:hypothetical protein